VTIHIYLVMMTYSIFLYYLALRDAFPIF